MPVCVADQGGVRCVCVWLIRVVSGVCVCVADQGGIRCVCVADQGGVRCVCVCG